MICLLHTREPGDTPESSENPQILKGNFTGGVEKEGVKPTHSGIVFGKGLRRGGEGGNFMIKALRRMLNFEAISIVENKLIGRYLSQFYLFSKTKSFLFRAKTPTS